MDYVGDIYNDHYRQDLRLTPALSNLELPLALMALPEVLWVHHSHNARNHVR